MPRDRPCDSLPVIFVRVPERTHNLAVQLARADGRSVSQWVGRLIEAQRPFALSAGHAQMVLHDDGPL
jgi:hypothetical protein